MQGSFLEQAFLVSRESLAIMIIQQPVVVQQPQVIYGTAPGCVTTTRFFGHRPFGWSHGSYRHGHPRHFRSGSSFSIGFGFCN